MATEATEVRSVFHPEVTGYEDVNRDSMRLLAKYGMESIGYWIPQDSVRSKNTLIYILAHPSREEARANWRRWMPRRTCVGSS